MKSRLIIATLIMAVLSLVEIASANNPDRPSRQEIVTTQASDSVMEALKYSDSPVLFVNVPLNHDFMTLDFYRFVTVSPEQKAVDYVSFSCGDYHNAQELGEQVTCGPFHSEDINDGTSFQMYFDDIPLLMADGTVQAIFAIDHP